MVDLVGGDWNDEYWGPAGGFIYGCQGDFGVWQAKAKMFATLTRACCMNETGVFVLDQFRGSGKEWKFKMLEVRNSF